jgi:hypothetical protein
MDPLTFSEDVERRKRAMLPMAMSSLVSPGGTLSNSVQPGQALPMSMRQRLGKVYDELDKIEGQEVDTSALQAFAKQQGQAGEQAMLNALAAQYAGENFQPVQAQFLKRAAAASEPMKLGAGMLTPDGQYIKDPFASRDARRASLERQATTMQGAIDRQEREERDRQDRLRQQQISNDFREQGLALQGVIAGNTNENRNFTRATTLRNEYGKKADKIGEGVRHAETVMTLLTDPDIKQNPTKQVALVFAFGKMLDPESVVRESEYALIANARGVFQGLIQKPDQLMTGARLTPEQLSSMQAIAGQLFAGADQRRNDLAAAYRSMAERNGLRVEDVLPMMPRVGAGGGAGGDDKLSPAERAELRRLRERFGQGAGGQ